MHGTDAREGRKTPKLLKRARRNRLSSSISWWCLALPKPRDLRARPSGYLPTVDYNDSNEKVNELSKNVGHASFLSLAGFEIPPSMPDAKQRHIELDLYDDWP